MFDSTVHGTAAIWAHLIPVLRFLKSQQPEVKYINFWNDGATTQYRNKHHFALTSYLTYDEGFVGGMWNFFEARHGKNSADAVGGVLKCTADHTVDHGKAVKDVALVGETAEVLFRVTSDIKCIENKIPQTVKPVTGTMKLHQFQLVDKGHVTVHNFSCFYQRLNVCNCLNAHHVYFPILLENEMMTA